MMPVSAAMPLAIWSPALVRRDNAFTLFRRSSLIVVRQADGGSFSDAHFLRLLLGRERQ